MNGATPAFHQNVPHRETAVTGSASAPADPIDLNQRFVSADPVSRALGVEIDALAARHTTALILGESGVGKERIAREIHDRSPRKDGPFVAVDCSSFPETLIESQLFGHVRGAFTGADFDHPGYIRSANGGTLFLDEVGDMPLSLQTRLLRVLQERYVIPVGQTKPVSVDVRVVAATNHDLPELVRQGRFREDLFYRLSAYRMIVPPLRERVGDILPLAEYFLDLQAAVYEEPRRSLSDQAKRWLQEQPWRGNVRELANAIEYALVTSTRPELMPEDFPAPLLEQGASLGLDAPAPSMPTSPADVPTMREAEWQALMAALHATAGDKTRAARLLGISRSRLYSMMAREGVDPAKHTSRSAS